MPAEEGSRPAEPSTPDPAADPRRRIAKVALDERTVVRRSPEVEHERAVAIFDLIEENYFSPMGELVGGDNGGPYSLFLGIEENRLVIDIRTEADEPLGKVILALTPFRRIVKDYFQICESYYQAIKAATPSQIEAIDMGRRGLHNEGSDLLRERLGGKIELDNNTARRLFTLICVLHIRG
jgi:uncharacterized protein (UPF0262 family)